MNKEFRKWWMYNKGSEKWAEEVDKDILGAIEMVFKAGKADYIINNSHFRLGDKVNVMVDGEEQTGRFVGVDSDGVVTYRYQCPRNPEVYLTAWLCNVYKPQKR